MGSELQVGASTFTLIETVELCEAKRIIETDSKPVHAKQTCQSCSNPSEFLRMLDDTDRAPNVPSWHEFVLKDAALRRRVLGSKSKET